MPEVISHMTLKEEIEMNETFEREKLILTFDKLSLWTLARRCFLSDMYGWMSKAEIVQSPILVTDTCVIFCGGGWKT